MSQGQEEETEPCFVASSHQPDQGYIHTELHEAENQGRQGRFIPDCAHEDLDLSSVSFLVLSMHR